jgi:nitrate reductase alpha subunit
VAEPDGELLAPLLPAGEPVEGLLRKVQFFVPGGTPSTDFREVHRRGGRAADEFYRDRWHHDKVVRSTHGVNCTGSCSWQVYVKDGIITWETQQTDYPYVRGELLRLWSFYDWYADLPPASPQVFGDQTDVPESGDWWNAAYLIIWGTNLPITRTPDAHFMTEARYKGQKVVVVSPDYSDHTKFADDWLPAAPGTDGALVMAMGHVILSEFFRDRQVPYFTDYVKTYTDAPFLVTLRERGDGYLPDRFLTAADLGESTQGAGHKTVVLDAATGEPNVPNGSLGFRFTESGLARWNLNLADAWPTCTGCWRSPSTTNGMSSRQPTPRTPAG